MLSSLMSVPSIQHNLTLGCDYKALSLSLVRSTPCVKRNITEDTSPIRIVFLCSAVHDSRKVLSFTLPLIVIALWMFDYYVYCLNQFNSLAGAKMFRTLFKRRLTWQRVVTRGLSPLNGDHNTHIVRILYNRLFDKLQLIDWFTVWTSHSHFESLVAEKSFDSKLSKLNPVLERNVTQFELMLLMDMEWSHHRISRMVYHSGEPKTGFAPASTVGRLVTVTCKFRTLRWIVRGLQNSADS